MDIEEDFGNNQLEDVSWLCSLSESELDMLICLKKLVIQRAKIIGCNVLAEKFDLKMLRAIGFILMEYLKGRLKDLSAIQGFADSAAFLEGCNLLNCNLNDSISLEELMACINIDSKKREAERGVEAAKLVG
ncbi:hypothetical protein L1049_024546 [Liquidambar formosana]|uniref:Gamma-tubulin complex component n=1 Tax=Liquidambar formosana TaxID=63359 RepID=A0AAP0X540_LIQFO